MRQKKRKCWVCEKVKANTLKCGCLTDWQEKPCTKRVCRACAWKNRNL
jgi:hypothetical protein